MPSVATASLSAGLTGHSITAYEARQAVAIAQWKSTSPSRLTEAVEWLTAPIAWGVRQVAPASVVRQAVALLDRLADAKVAGWPGSASPSREDVLDRRRQPLEDCDLAAASLLQQAERVSAGRGLVLRHLGNAVLGRVPFQLVAALATIKRIGNCYGYPLDRPVDRAVLLDLLEIALVEDPGKRAVVLARMHAALDAPDAALLDADAIAAQAGRDVLADELADELLARVPLVGSLVGFIGDRTFVRIAGEGAMHFFQERRLRDEGKVAEILPSPQRRRRSSFSEVGRALGETVYAGGAIVGFAATFPVAVVGHIAGRSGGSIVAGAAAGGRAAASAAAVLIGPTAS